MEVRNWLDETYAEEIMVRDVVTLAPTTTLARAAKELLNEQISGAPIVDDTGVCLGVLSAADLVGAEEKVSQQAREIASSSFWNSNLSLPMSVYAEELGKVRDQIAPAAEQPVDRFMTTTSLAHVRGDTPLSTVVRALVDAHVHRVVVLDENRRLCGIISTTDVMAALLRAAR